jgi:DNA polymerase III alpha subunit
MSDEFLHVDDSGTPYMTNQGIVELAYQDKLSALFEWQDPEAKQHFQQQCEKLDHWPFELHTVNSDARTWFTPDEYKNIDLRNYLLSRCNSDVQRERAETELELVDRFQATHIFQHLIYLVDQWRSKGLVWGVGRGSSVSCFLLYLIGVNKINPLDYDLDHREFFKL